VNPRNSIIYFLDKALTLVEAPVIIVCGVLLIGLLTYTAICRYFLFIDVPYEDELSRLFFTWLSLLGASYLLRSGDHPTVTLLSDRVVRRGVRIGKIYQAVIYVAVIAFLVVILYATLETLPLYYAYYSTVLRLPMVYYYYAGVVGLAFMIVRYSIKIALLPFKGG